MDNGYPVITPPVPRRLHPRHTRQRDETVRHDANTETPSFRLAGLEVGEGPANHRVGQEVLRRRIQRCGGAGKSTTELFQLRDVHAGVRRRPSRNQIPNSAAAQPSRSGGSWHAYFISKSRNDSAQTRAEGASFWSRLLCGRNIQLANLFQIQILSCIP